jgi:hypothetical protein
VAVAWFQKFLGLGKKDNTVLTIKLRLNRWRHFLRTEWSCLNLLDDLEEKSRGEYIFDRQYVYSTVGRIFQKAYQMAYDGSLLLQNPEKEFYDWLDLQKEKTQTYLAQFSKEAGDSKQLSIPPIIRSETNSTLGKPWPTEPSLDQEPEFIMLNGVITILSGNHAQKKRAEALKLAEVDDLRSVLRWMHEKVLREFITPETAGQWVKSGLALSYGERPFPSCFVVDLGREPFSGNKTHVVRTFPLGAEKPRMTWPVIQGLLTALTRNLSSPSGQNNRSLCFITDENALFLFGSDAETFIWLDMFLTHVRELNHFLFRWQRRSERNPADLKRLPGFEWTYQEEGRVYEFMAFQKPPREIESYGELLGRA